MTEQIAIDYINQIRKDPSSLAQKFYTVSKALSRARRKIQSKDVAGFSQQLTEKEKLSELEKSAGLCNAAEEIVKGMIFRGEDELNMPQNEFESILAKHVSSFKNPVYMLSVGEIDNILIRLLISEKDPNKQNQQVVFGESYKYIGAYSRQFDEDDLTLIIFSEEVEEQPEEEDYPELREMFKTLDQHNTGFLIPEVIYDSLISLQFDVKNQTFVEIFRKLKTSHPNGVDYTTFKNTVLLFHVKPINTRKDWEKVFNLFVDDSIHNTISINNIKRIAYYLDEEISIPELKKYMKWATDNGSEMTFDEFYDVMTTNIENPIEGITEN